MTNNLRLTSAIWPFIGAILCFGLCGLLPNHPKYLFLIGWTLLAVAYLVVLRRSYERKTPLYTRGGSLRYEQQPRLYKAVYLFLFLVGVFMIVTLILSWALY
jgi:hypothetical protein